jgi:hypothetical protein
MWYHFVLKEILDHEEHEVHEALNNFIHNLILVFVFFVSFVVIHEFPVWSRGHAVVICNSFAREECT